jgi:hypothetical protein
MMVEPVHTPETSVYSNEATRLYSPDDSRLLNNNNNNIIITITTTFLIMQGHV